MTATVTTHKFTADEYQRMGEVGILCEDDRVELIEGEIVDMAAIGNRHQAAVDRLNKLFVQLAGNEAIVRVQGSVRLNERNEPQPDLVILRPRDDFYVSQFAGPADTFLVIEVADTTLAYDRDVKSPLYARTRIQEFWLVDIEDRSITVFRQPAPDGYSSVRTLRGADNLSPAALPRVSLTPNVLFP